MCKCKNIDIGSYNAQISFKAPNWSSKDVINIDLCLKDEILNLWKHGIVTSGCCCGHNKNLGYIGVYPESVNKMLELGYIIQTNNNDVNRVDSFYPKSIDINPEQVENYLSNFIK